MNKSHLIQAIAEVLSETIRKVNGKYVVYPEKGGRRLGTHATKAAAEKQLTAIHLNKEAVEIKFTNPNFSTEWEEAVRYPEFVEIGKQGWVDLAKKGKSVPYSSIKDVLGNVDLNFEDLEEPKKERFQVAFQKGVIEMPIAAKFSDSDYDLVAGNTRLSGLVKNGIDPKIWIVDLSEIQENYKTGLEEEEQTVDFNLRDINGVKVVLATFGEDKVGALRLKPYKDSYQVDSVIVKPDYRGYGIGKEMYRLAHEKLGPLYSDAHQTPEASSLWNSLIKSGEAKKEGDRFVMTEGPHDAMNPGILSRDSSLKGADGKIKISKVRAKLSSMKDKGSTKAKALRRFINYHD